jgi:hypothetical protein
VRRRCVRVLAFLVCLVGTSTARARPTDPDGVDVSDVLRRYFQNPHGRARAALLEYGQGDIAGMPPVILLALGDAHLRAGDPASAGRMFEALSSRDPGPPWWGWAEIGLGWTSIVSGNLDGARSHYGAVASSGEPSRPIGVIGVALVDAADGGTRDAVAMLEPLTADARAHPSVRMTAAVVLGYAHLWGHEYRDAADTFDRAAEEFPGRRLTDDARYGAAIAEWRAGDRDGAIASLRALGGTERPGEETRPASPSILALEPLAILRAGGRRYRRMPLQMPEEQFPALLDFDGAALARAALRRLAPTGSVDEPSRLPMMPYQRTVAESPDRTTRPAAGAVPGVPAGNHAARDGGLLDLALGFTVLLAATAALGAYRRDRTGGRRR